MTNMIGSLRYMAKEVLLGQCYNESADVYSLTLVLWEMLSLEQPFAASLKTSMDQLESRHVQRVCFDNERPKLRSSSWSAAICNVLTQGWDSDLHQRCSMAVMQQVLRSEILCLRQGRLDGLGDLIQAAQQGC